MTDTESIIIKEALDPEGMVVGFRCGDEPTPERLDALNNALESLAVQAQGWNSIDRRLAGALHLLSFHAAGLIEAKSGGWSDAVEETMPLIYEQIDEILGILE